MDCTVPKSHELAEIFIYANTFQNVLIVDLDKKTFVRSQGDEGTLLPKKIEKALKTVLNMCRIDTGKLTTFPGSPVAQW